MKKLTKTEQSTLGIKQRFSTLSRYSNQIIISLSADFLITDFNSAAEHIYNCRRAKVLGKNYFKIFSKQQLKHITETALKKLTPTKPIRNREGIIQVKKGVNKVILWTAICLVEKVKGKKTKEYMLVGQDVTERRHYQELVKAKQKVEKKLIEKELYLETIIANLPGNVYWKNKQGVYLGCNENVAKAMKLASRVDMVGKTLHQMLDKEPADALNNVDLRVMKTGKVAIVEEQGLRLKDGWGTYLTHKVPLRDKKNNVTGLLGISFDITERKQLEVALEKSKAHAELQAKRANIYLENIVAALPGNVYWKDREHVYLGCNDNMWRLFGLSYREQFVGKTPDDFVAKEIAVMVRKNDDEVMESGVLSNFEETAFKPDGTSAVYLTSKVPLRDQDNKVIGMAGISFDITERKQMEQALNEAKDRAEMANRAKSEFLAAVSHELRIPLTGILGMAQLMEPDKLDADQNKQVGDIITAGQHLLALVNDLLDIAKLEASKLELHIAPVDLRKLIEEIATMVIFQCKSKGLDLQIDYASDVPHRIIGDARVLRQIVLNLVGNAVKFTEQGHVIIKVDCLEENKKRARLLLTVEDTGIGIPADKLENVFDRFNQVDSSRTRRYGGAGLGLTITKAYVELMGGTITVESEIAKGSKFICDVPFPLQNIAQYASLWEKYKSEVRVLVVDDCLRGAVIAKQINSSLCRVVASGEALNTFLAAQQITQAFDVVIMDQELQYMDAFSMAKMIMRQRGVAHPLLMLMSSSPTLATKEKAQAAGFQEILLKPVHPTELLTSLTAAWESWVERKDKSETLATAAVQGNKVKYSPKILLVEDDPIVQRVHIMMLKRAGCQVDIADNGKKALQMIRQGYDAIFMDVGLPNMSGMDIAVTIRRLEAGEKHTPIIGVTGYGNDEDKESCLAAGMDDVAIKPVPLEEVERLLHRWVFKEKITEAQL